MKFYSIIAALVAIFYAIFKVCAKTYIFDPITVNSICNEVIARHSNTTTQEQTRELFIDIRDSLAKVYSDEHINLYDDTKWMFNNAGGAMGQMLILHASFHEYLIIFGTATGTEGHTGVHTSDDYFTIIKGEQWAAYENEFVREIYTPGMTLHLKKGHVKQYAMPAESFAVELAQGFIPGMLPFGFADGIFSTLDIKTLYKTVVITGSDMIKRCVAALF